MIHPTSIAVTTQERINGKLEEQEHHVWFLTGMCA